MSIVNRQVLNEIRELQRSAIATDSYASGYHRLNRAASLAIAQLEQLDMATQGFKIVVEKA